MGYRYSANGQILSLNAMIPIKAGNQATAAMILA